MTVGTMFIADITKSFIKFRMETYFFAGEILLTSHYADSKIDEQCDLYRALLVENTAVEQVKSCFTADMKRCPVGFRLWDIFYIRSILKQFIKQGCL